ncbi:unnamed protein product [Arctogadus glacialis]
MQWRTEMLVAGSEGSFVDGAGASMTDAWSMTSACCHEAPPYPPPVERGAPPPCGGPRGRDPGLGAEPARAVPPVGSGEGDGVPDEPRVAEEARLLLPSRGWAASEWPGPHVAVPEALQGPTEGKKLRLLSPSEEDREDGSSRWSEARVSQKPPG